MEEVVAGIAATFKATIDFRYHRLFPATVNTPEHAEFVAEVATELFGADKVVANLTPSMGSEDFSVMLQQRPGAYFRQIGRANVWTPVTNAHLVCRLLPDTKKIYISII